MTPAHDKPLFFIHVMKTAGSTLKLLFRDTYGNREVYPNAKDDANFIEANMSIAYLTELSSERKARTRVFSGHFPFAASEMLGLDCCTLTVLRDPVDRAVSHLRQVHRNDPSSRRTARSLHDVEEPSLEQVYADPYLHPMFFSNHQCRVFSITADDEPQSYITPMELDRGRLEVAKEQLARVDVVGTTEHFDRFRAELSERFGIPTDDGARRNEAPSGAPGVSESLRARIAEDNALDIELYEFALGLIADRRGG